MRGLRFPAAVLLAYAWLFPWLPELRSPGELARLYQARALVDDASPALNGVVARRGPVDGLVERAGRLLPEGAPGVSFLGAPVYAALRALLGGPDRVSDRAGAFFLRLLVCMLPGAAAAEMLRRILLRRFAPPLATAGATVFALGTVFWPYSTLLLGHGPAASALVASWYFLDRAREHPDSPARVRPERSGSFTAFVAHRGNYPLAGLFAGLAVLLDYPSLLGAAALGAYLLAGARRKARAALHALAGFAPPVALLAVYGAAAFGSPFAGPLDLGRPRLDVLFASFFEPRRGLFAYSPFLGLALPGLFLLRARDRALTALSAGALVLYGWISASVEPAAWGWTVGPRFAVPLAAFLVPAAMESAEWLRARGVGMFAAALAAASVGGMAILMAAGPYLPPDLTNPVHQLSVPLLAAGYHAHTLLGMALGTASTWTLLPWAALVLVLALRSALAFLPHALRTSTLFGAAALAAVLFLAGGTLGGPDRFAPTRRALAERWEPVPGRAPGPLAGP